MMNSFDFVQSPQPTLIEPATFVGPASSAITTTTSVAEFNPMLTYLMLASVVALAGAVSAFLIGKKFRNTG
jgi:hypothetical protein